MQGIGFGQVVFHVALWCMAVYVQISGGSGVSANTT
ncbi:unnamed protein product, partial [Didymodactylos carnosus]